MKTDFDFPKFKSHDLIKVMVFYSKKDSLTVAVFFWRRYLVTYGCNKII